MPVKALRPCSSPMCPQLAEKSLCPEHLKQKQQQRGTAHSRGYGHKWQNARLRFLSRSPLCVHCELEGLISTATVVDHIKPHKGDQLLFWDVDNWQSLCKTHHDIKTATEDGGFGRSNKFR